MSNLVIALPMSKAQIHQLTEMAEFEGCELHEMLRILISRGYVDHIHVLDQLEAQRDPSGDPDQNTIYNVRILENAYAKEELDDEIPF